MIKMDVMLNVIDKTDDLKLVINGAYAPGVPRIGETIMIRKVSGTEFYDVVDVGWVFDDDEEFTMLGIVVTKITFDEAADAITSS